MKLAERKFQSLGVKKYQSGSLNSKELRIFREQEGTDVKSVNVILPKNKKIILRTLPVISSWCKGEFCVETKPTPLVYKWGAHAHGCQHQVQCLFVCWLCKWMSCTSFRLSWLAKSSFSIHLLSSRLRDDEAWWISLVFFFFWFQGSRSLKSLEFCGAVNCLYLCSSCISLIKAQYRQYVEVM